MEPGELYDIEQAAKKRVPGDEWASIALNLVAEIRDMRRRLRSLEDERDSEIYDLARMARLLRVPSTWLKAEAEASRIPAVKAGKTMLFHKEQTIKCLAERAARGDK